MNHYSRAIAESEKDIVVIAMCPGWVQTDMGGSNANLTVDHKSR